jgi:hypothetical protein
MTKYRVNVPSKLVKKVKALPWDIQGKIQDVEFWKRLLSDEAFTSGLTRDLLGSLEADRAEPGAEDE